MKAALVVCLVAVVSLVIAAHARPLVLTAWHTAYVDAAWPAQAAVSLYERTQHPHWLTALQRPGRGQWRPIGWTRWTLPAWRERNYRALQANTPHARLVRWALLGEAVIAALIVVTLLKAALLALIKAWWGWLWSRILGIGQIEPGTTGGLAAWATGRELRTFRPRKAGASFILGRVGRRVVALPEKQQYLNTLVVGRPGAGKSVLLSGILLRETGARSLVVADPKSEQWDVTSAHLARVGMRPLRLDFYDPAGAGYNPLRHVRDATEALLFAQTWLANTRKPDDTNGFWDDTCCLLMQAAVLHLNDRYKDVGGATLPQLGRYLSTMTAEEVKSDLATSPNETAQEVAEGFLRNTEGNERLARSIFVGLPLRFMALQDERLRAVTSHDDIDRQAMGQAATGPATALYVILTRGREDILKPLTACLFTQVFGQLVEVANASPRHELPCPVLVILDEAGTIGAIQGLPQWLATLRSARVGCVLAFQALAQAAMLYGPEGRENIEENCQTHLLFGGAGHASAAWMSAGIGDHTVIQRGAGAGRDRSNIFAGTGSKSASETSAPLVRPEEITELEPGTLLARIAHHRPMKVRVMPWYRSRRLKHRAGRYTPPTVPTPTTTPIVESAPAAATTEASHA